jgi:lipopolysaccharide/colanic/teichoic acid biosynthesis glycosyltransferase
MSIVGPRPPLPEEVSKYSPLEMVRLSVTPGITCLWQVSGRSDCSFEQWVELDRQYIRTVSLLTDLRIIARTLPAVVGGRGAY